MGIEFQCEECGQLLNIETEPGAAATCSHCGASVIVPAALASLPQPQVDGAAPAHQPPPPMAVDGEYDQGYEEDEYFEEEHGEDSAVLAVMAHSMPWVISVFFHVGLAVIFFLLMMIAAQIEEVIEEKQPPVNSSVFTENPGGAVSTGRSSKTEKASQNKRKIKAQGDSERELDIPNEGTTGETSALIGAAAGAGGGSLAGYGLTDGSGSGPRSGFGGLGGNAHHIVYLIDRSGSMFDTFEAVKREICNSVGKLNPVQDFHVIMFADGAPLEKTPIALSHPTDANKRALAAFLKDVKAEKTTNPIKGINRAFDVLANANRKPGKIIYMLTDGNFSDNKAVIDLIAARNAKGEVLVNTFLYGWKPVIAEQVMKEIADKNGGDYRYVSPDE